MFVVFSKSRSEGVEDDSIGIRQLSHDTTKVLKDLEASPRLVAVTRHGRIVAVLIPTSVPALFKQWLSLNPRRAARMRAAAVEAIPGLEFAEPDDEVQEIAANDVLSVGIKEFAQATSEYLRRAEDGDWVFLRRHSRVIALLVRFSLPELVELKMRKPGVDLMPAPPPEDATTADDAAGVPHSM